MAHLLLLTVILSRSIPCAFAKRDLGQSVMELQELDEDDQRRPASLYESENDSKTQMEASQHATENGKFKDATQGESLFSKAQNDSKTRMEASQHGAQKEGLSSRVEEGHGRWASLSDEAQKDSNIQTEASHHGAEKEGLSARGEEGPDAGHGRHEPLLAEAQMDFNAQTEAGRHVAENKGVSPQGEESSGGGSKLYTSLVSETQMDFKIPTEAGKRAAEEEGLSFRGKEGSDGGHGRRASLLYEAQTSSDSEPVHHETSTDRIIDSNDALQGDAIISAIEVQPENVAAVLVSPTETTSAEMLNVLQGDAIMSAIEVQSRNVATAPPASSLQTASTASLPGVEAKMVTYIRQHRLPGSGQDFFVATGRNTAGTLRNPGVQFWTADGKLMWGYWRPRSAKKQVSIFEGQASLGNILVVLATGRGSAEYLTRTTVNPAEGNGHPVLYIFDMSADQFKGIPDLSKARNMEPDKKWLGVSNARNVKPDKKVVLEGWNAALHVDLVNVRQQDDSDGTNVLQAVISSGFNTMHPDCWTTKTVDCTAQMAVVTIAVGAAGQAAGKTSLDVDHLDSNSLQFSTIDGRFKPQYVRLKKANAPPLPYAPEGTLVIPHPDGMGAVVYTSGVNPKKGGLVQAVTWRAGGVPKLLDRVAVDGRDGSKIADIGQFVGRSFTKGDGTTYIVAADFNRVGSVVLYEVQWEVDQPLLHRVHRLYHKNHRKTNYKGLNRGANRVILRKFNNDIYAFVPFKGVKHGSVHVYRVFDSESGQARLQLFARKKVAGAIYTAMVVSLRMSSTGLVANLIVPIYSTGLMEQVEIRIPRQPLLV